MPPLPPTMYGGGDYWAGQTNRDSDGNVVDRKWNRNNLNKALNNLDGDRYESNGIWQNGTAIGYNGILAVLNAIEAGYLFNLEKNEWGEL